jgi:fused signal recognition particle receptor
MSLRFEFPVGFSLRRGRYIEKLKAGLSRTHENIFSKIDKLVYGKNKIDEDLLVKIEEILISSDVGVESAEAIMNTVKERVNKERYERPDELYSILKEEIRKVFVGLNGPARESGKNTNPIKKPYVIVVVGVNGTGKTTTVGKLAYNYKNSGSKVLIGAADTFRAAANEQLETWAERAGVEMIKLKYGSDPGAVVYDTLNSALARNVDVVIIDTAGRLHTKTNLMEELKKIFRVIKKVIPDAPHEVLLVMDATTGQNGVVQARQFSSAVPVTGLVLTKLDGTAKGGIVLRIAKEFNIPVNYIGVGEQIDDLQPFDAKAFAEALVG